MTSVLVAVAAAPTAHAATVSGPVLFGMDAGAIAAESAAGVKPDYGTFWIGPWTLASGWGGPDSQLKSMAAAGVTPAIQFYYWGDDISPTCIENGCWSTQQNLMKDKADWQTLAAQFVQHLNADMGGKPVVVFVETEFNKGSVATYTPLDGYLADKANFIRAGYPAAKIVMPLGNWAPQYWTTWQKFAAASDYVGLQGLRGSTRDTLTFYMGLYDATLSGAKTAQSLFGKAIFLDDIGLSSYTEPTWVQPQADALAKFFNNMATLKAAGVQALIYRSWYDTPGMNPANYYGYAEQHWGLAYPSSGALKPSATVWANGVKAERAGVTPAPAPAPAPSNFTATFAPSQNVNNWWVEVGASSASALSAVAAQVNGGSWHALPKDSWGTYAASFFVATGASVVFRANDTAGHTALSGTYSWLSTASAPAPAPTYTAPNASFAATMTNLSGAFDASASSDPNGLALSYAWAFGDGTTSTGAKVSHAYAAAGTYTVTLTVNDTKLSSSTTHSVTAVQPNRPPVASFTATMSGLTGAFDGSASSDPDGNALTYAWAFGDGTTGTGVKASHTYAAGATYTVTLTVSDGSLTSSLAKSVTAVQPNRPPVASFTATMSGLTGAFDGSASSDPDGNALTYAWAFGDGTTATGVKVSHTYVAGGTYTVTLTVSDGQLANALSKSVTATAPTTTFAAKFTLSPNVNSWWVEVGVTANQPIAKVEVRIDGGSWITLPKDSWGTYAKSIHVYTGQHVVFRATSTTGATFTSATYTWQ